MLLVGCPAARRGWILNRWAEHIETACQVAGVDHQLIVAADPGDDAWPALTLFTDRLIPVHIDDPRAVDVRDWQTRGYDRIIAARNELLAAVRAHAPDVFISVDSDVLLHRDTVKHLLETLDQFDAVGGYTFMDETRRCPSWGRLTRSGGIDRTDVPGYVGPVDVIMAIKAMKPAAYRFDYVTHPKGEDVGICIAWRAGGLTVGFDARVASKHVMHRDRLHLLDGRCGF